MSYRIAVASTDGIVVNQHFGRADTFYILDVAEDQSYSVAGIRHLSPVCQGGNHDTQAIEDSVSQLEDCQYLLVSRIGPGAEAVVSRHGIETYVIPDLIEEAVHKVIAHVEINALIQSFAGASC